MKPIEVRSLQDGLSFGARVLGLTRENLADEATRAQLNDLFEDRGVIVFEDVEPTSEMQVLISNVFGPLKEHPVKIVRRVDEDEMLGVIEIRNDPENSGIIELEGRRLANYQPWHFDHCYNDELNRGGVLRSVEIPPDDGFTAFADGIQLYNDFSPDLRERMEECNVIYTLNMLFDYWRFGKPSKFREVKKLETGILAVANSMPRAVHPAVWTRKTGEKVLHFSGWYAVGLENKEDPEGDELFEAVCQEMRAKVKPYIHKWRPTDMIIWDNWRMLHQGCGCDPKHARLMHRTTIKGDYELGYFENGGKTEQVLGMM